MWYGMIRELSYDPHNLADIVMEFYSGIGVSNDIRDVGITDQAARFELSDSTVFFLQRPVGHGQPWTSWVQLSGAPSPVDLVVPDIEQDVFRLAAWAAGQMFVVLDSVRVEEVA